MCLIETANSRAFCNLHLVGMQILLLFVILLLHRYFLKTYIICLFLELTHFCQHNNPHWQEANLCTGCLGSATLILFIIWLYSNILCWINCYYVNCPNPFSLDFHFLLVFHQRVVQSFTCNLLRTIRKNGFEETGQSILL